MQSDFGEGGGAGSCVYFHLLVSSAEKDAFSVNTHAYLYIIYICVCVHMCVYVYMCVRVCMCAHVCMCVYVYLCVCVCIYAHFDLPQ